MIFTLELFDTPHIPMVRAACRRVQRPGGRLGVVALSGRNLTLGSRRYEAAHDRFLTAVDCRPIYAHRAVESGGFVLTHALVDGLWGMSVEIVVATNTG